MAIVSPADGSRSSNGSKDIKGSSVSHGSNGNPYMRAPAEESEAFLYSLYEVAKEVEPLQWLGRFLMALVCQMAPVTAPIASVSPMAQTPPVNSVERKGFETLNLGGNVTKFKPHEALKLIMWR